MPRQLILGVDAPVDVQVGGSLVRAELEQQGEEVPKQTSDPIVSIGTLASDTKRVLDHPKMLVQDSNKAMHDAGEGGDADKMCMDVNGDEASKGGFHDKKGTGSTE